MRGLSDIERALVDQMGDDVEMTPEEEEAADSLIADGRAYWETNSRPYWKFIRLTPLGVEAERLDRVVRHES